MMTMPKISVEVGYTLAVKPGSYEFAKYTIRVDEIDTSAPLEPQLTQAAGIVTQTAEWLESRLYEQINGAGLLETVRQR